MNIVQSRHSFARRAAALLGALLLAVATLLPAASDNAPDRHLPRWRLAELYLAYFDRAPHLEEALAWTAGVTDPPDWLGLARRFHAAAAPLLGVPTPPTPEGDARLVDTLYRHLFGAEPDAAMRDYLLNAVATELIPRDQLAYALIHFIWTNEHQEPARAYLGNRVKVALAFAGYEAWHGIKIAALPASRQEELHAASFTVLQNVGSDLDDVAIGVLDINDALYTFAEFFRARSLLNDTGILYCRAQFRDDVPCPAWGFFGQDADYGRDVTHRDQGDGHGGFSFTKLDLDGNPLPAGARDWACVRDNVTGLVWEHKTSDGGLRDVNNTYTWYQPDATSNGGYAGAAHGGTCPGGACDTATYTRFVNGLALCGRRDWRVPTALELQALVNYGRYDPAIDVAYFPTTRAGRYWSATPNAASPRYAWHVDFAHGTLSYDDRSDKNQPAFLRLVSGGVGDAAVRPLGDQDDQRDPIVGIRERGTCNHQVLPSTPHSRFIDNGDGTVTDIATGLMWQQCVVGVGGSRCEQGMARTFTWHEALEHAFWYDDRRYDWRLPDIKELASLIERRCNDPAINSRFFPNTPVFEHYWSASPDADFWGRAWSVDFANGTIDAESMTNTRYVRLVRTLWPTGPRPQTAVP